MSKIIAPLEPQSNPFAYLSEVDDLLNRFPHLPRDRTRAAIRLDGADMVVSLEPGDDPWRHAVLFKLVGLPWRVETR